MTRLLTIALILVATAGWAQSDTTIDFSMYQPQREWSIIAYSDSTDMNEIAVSMILPLLNEYAEVCWNDSTYIDPDDFYIDARTMQPEPSYWHHKTPTFSDFIKWLNKLSD